MMDLIEKENTVKAQATISIELNIYTRKMEMYILSCNSYFSELTNLNADARHDMSRTAFGFRKQEYLKKLLLDELQDENGNHLLYFETSENYLSVRNIIMGNGIQEFYCSEIC